MNTHADLEIGLHRKDADSYTVELRFSQPDDQADLAPERGLAHFDFEDLRAHTLDSEAYGQRLTQSLFSDPPVLAIFSKACAVSQALDKALRLRLFIDRSAPELHSLRWETLQNPQDGSSLVTSEHILFSRYLRSLDWRPVRLRPRGDLRALVVIANPANLIDYKLAPIDAADEVRRVKSGLGNISVNELASQGSATLENLLAYLRQGYDIFYLVCHGTLDKSEPWLWMEDEVGDVARVPGSELVTRLSELQQRPALVVLASCQSAGSDANRPRISEGVLAALGPRLAEAGIPAVLAMQGDVSMQTVAQFMPVFFQELQRDGQIDRAMAVARGAVRDRPDSWMPVVFMRLKSGRIWYVPGFTGEFKKWPVLLRSILDGQCTPILGPGLTESLLGSSREIARRWAETYHFPLAPHDRDDLPQVAQYLAVNQAPGFPRSELREYLRQEILQRYGSTLPPETHTASLDEMVQVVGAQRRAIDPTEPHNVLAHLPFPIFITTNAHNLLTMALRDANKQPEVELCPWTKPLCTESAAV